MTHLEDFNVKKKRNGALKKSSQGSQDEKNPNELNLLTDGILFLNTRKEIF